MPTDIKNLLAKAVKHKTTKQEGTVENKTGSKTPAVKSIFGGKGPSIITGELPSSRGYSVQKAMQLAHGAIDPSQAKLEVNASDMLNDLYGGIWRREQKSVMLPLGLDLMPDEVQHEQKFKDIKDMVLAGAKAADPDEIQHIKKAFWGTKAQSWIDQTIGGSMVGAPVQGELIDLLRNKLAFGGATITSMPPTGVKFPRETSPSAFSWASENQITNASNIGTGALTLLPKKGVAIAEYPNELVMYGSPSVDAMFRASLMKTVALGMDSGLLEGDGTDDQPLGLKTMAELQSQDPTNYDFGLNLVTIGTGGNGDITSAPQHLMKFPRAIESRNGQMNHWIGRPDFFWSILMQRWSTIANGDQQGGFLYDFARAAKDGFPDQLIGRTYNKTNQVSFDDTNTDPRTYLIGLDITDYWIGMLGAVEILSSTEAGEAFDRDQTKLRAKIYGNGGPKHPGQVAIALNVQIPDAD